jgi:hypothetical protein
VAQEPNGEQVPAPSDERLSWEVVEILGAGFLGSAISWALFSTVSGIVYGFSSIAQPSSPFGGSLQPGPSVAEIMERSTVWATPWVGLIVLGALGAAWWQVEGWATFVADEDESSKSERDSGVAYRHLLRAQSMTSCVIIVLALLSGAVLVLIISTFVLNAGEGPENLVISQDLDLLGEGIATLILVAVGFVVAARLRSSVRVAFGEVGADEFDDEEDGDSE